MDAVHYARDIKEGDLQVDAGHLIWRPLGASLWASFRVLFPNLDPLIPLRVLSSAGAGLTCLLSFALARRLGLNRSQATSVLILVGGSQVLLAYGGSGSSYTAAMAFSVLSVLTLFRYQNKDWNWVVAAMAVTAFVIACITWLLSLLALPTVWAAAAMTSSGAITRRLWRASVICIIILAAITISLISAYLTRLHPDQPSSAQNWISASAHGAPVNLSLISTARGAYGFLVSYVHGGSSGRLIKALLFGEFDYLSSAKTALNLLIVATFMFSVLAAAVGLFRGWKTTYGLNFKIVFLALSCLIPCAVFASVWNGSDVERYSPAVPFTSIAIVYGLSYFSPLSIKGILPARIPLNCLFATFVITANIGTFILPRLIGESALTVQLGRKASEHMHSGDLLVVTGQDLWAPIKSATEYLYGIKVHNIHFLVSGYGPRD